MDFRTYLGVLEQAGDLIRIREPLHLDYDIGALCRQLSDADGPAALVQKLEERLGAPFTIVFGQTECSPVATMTSPSDSTSDKANTIGLPLPNVEVRIINPDTGKTAAIGEIGEFCTRGYLVMHGYFEMVDATKAAIETMTAVLSKELRGRSITANAVAPGPVATDLFLNGKPPELIDRLAKMNPLERLGTPEDIAASVAFLAGPDGAWINGQTLRPNGGMV